MKTKSLAFIAGIIWLIAGFNVCRIGVVSWMSLDTISPFMIIGSIIRAQWKNTGEFFLVS